MPHFENLEKYESQKSPSGRKRIIPIAPHSVQAADYRPNKSDKPKPVMEKAPQFKEVEFEPVSVRQMEKEFKQAARDPQAPRHRKKTKSLKKRITKFFKGLLSVFGKDKGKGKKRPSRRRQSSRPNDQKEGPQGGQPPAQKNKRRRKKRPGGNAPEQRNKSGGPQKGRQSGPPSGEKNSEGSSNTRNRKRNRSRRNRGPHNKGQQGPSKPKSGKDN